MIKSAFKSKNIMRYLIDRRLSTMFIHLKYFGLNFDERDLLE